MAMIQNKTYKVIIAIFIVLMEISVVHAQQITTNDMIKTRVIDWSIPPDFIASNEYKKSKKCGSISFDMPSWATIVRSHLIIRKKFKNDDRSDIFYGGIAFGMLCKLQINLSQDNITFNDATKQWELSKEDQNNYVEGTKKKIKADQIYQLHAQNAFGWVHTMISFDVMGGSYTKIANFCLFNDKKTKQLCGSGNPQYIPSQKQLGTTKFDYTPILINILNTAKFLDDK